MANKCSFFDCQDPDNDELVYCQEDCNFQVHQRCVEEYIYYNSVFNDGMYYCCYHIPGDVIRNQPFKTILRSNRKKANEVLKHFPQRRDKLSQTRRQTRRSALIEEAKNNNNMRTRASERVVKSEPGGKAKIGRTVVQTRGRGKGKGGGGSKQEEKQAETLEKTASVDYPGGRRTKQAKSRANIKQNRKNKYPVESTQEMAKSSSEEEFHEAHARKRGKNDFPTPSRVAIRTLQSQDKFEGK